MQSHQKASDGDVEENLNSDKNGHLIWNELSEKSENQPTKEKFLINLEEQMFKHNQPNLLDNFDLTIKSTDGLSNSFLQSVEPISNCNFLSIFIKIR